MPILSIQSNVVHGHVGNAAAVFPLQRLGFEVWAVDTVRLSNHKGYGGWRGRVSSPAEVSELIEGLIDRGVLQTCEAVLSGYLGDAALGKVLLDTVGQVRARNPGALYCCDPVMGDREQGVFVDKGIPEVLRRRAVPMADIITPNQFELELLTGTRIETLEEAVAAARQAQGLGPDVVVVTSLRHAETPDDRIEMLAVTAEGAWRVVTPFLDMDPAPNGAGDALAALYLGHYLKTPPGPDRAAMALAAAAAAIYAVVERTARDEARELRLIEAQAALLEPPRFFSVDLV